MNSQINSQHMLAFFAATTLLIAPAQAVEVVYEDFDYTNVGGGAGSDPIDGLSGGSGWGGDWVADDDGGAAGVLDHSFEITSGGLTFSTLPVDGKATDRVGTSNRAIGAREISTTATNLLLGDNSTMWFSFLYKGGASGNDFAFAFGDAALHPKGNSNGQSPNFTDPSNAFAFFSEGSSFSAAEYVNSNTLSKTGSVAASSTTRLIVGKINWKENGTADEFFLYDVTDLNAPDTAPGTLIGSHTANFDQAGALDVNNTFDTISFWSRPNIASTVDEIRLATSFEGALGVPEPSSLALLGLGGLLISRRRRG